MRRKTKKPKGGDFIQARMNIVKLRPIVVPKRKSLSPARRAVLSMSVEYGLIAPARLARKKTLTQVNINPSSVSALSTPPLRIFVCLWSESTKATLPAARKVASSDIVCLADEESASEG